MQRHLIYQINANIYHHFQRTLHNRREVIIFAKSVIFRLPVTAVGSVLGVFPLPHFHTWRLSSCSRSWICPQLKSFLRCARASFKSTSELQLICAFQIYPFSPGIKQTQRHNELWPSVGHWHLTTAEWKPACSLSAVIFCCQKSVYTKRVSNIFHINTSAWYQILFCPTYAKVGQSTRLMLTF